MDKATFAIEKRKLLEKLAHTIKQAQAAFTAIQGVTSLRPPMETDVPPDQLTRLVLRGDYAGAVMYVYRHGLNS